MGSYVIESVAWALFWLILGFILGYYQGRKGNNGTPGI